MIASYNLGEKIIRRKDLLSYMNNMLAVHYKKSCSVVRRLPKVACVASIFT